MTLSAARWTEVTPSQYRWEQEALQWLRDNLPDEDGWHVWTNCEFLTSSGAIYEIDALILSPVGLFVVEIKSQPGKLRSEDGLWVFDHEGRRHTIENPVFLTNRKAKALKGTLQTAAGNQHESIPWVAPLVLLAGTGLEFGLQESEIAHVVLPDHKAAVTKGRVTGITHALTTGQVLGVDHRQVSPVNRRQQTIISRAIAQVTRSVTARTKVGDYNLTKLLGEGIGYQDWLGTHQTLKNTNRRIRWYLVRDQAEADERARIQRAAEREANILQCIRDPGILAFRELISTERGPALTFDYQPQAVQLDHWLAQREQRLDACSAFELLEKLTQAVRQAHNHHLVHRALSPAAILVMPDQQNPQKIPDVALTNWATALALAGDAKTTGTLHVEDLLDSRAAAYCAPEALKSPDQADDRADVFSLGCLAWLLFTGKPPAATHLDIDRQLAAHGALKLTGAIDGVPPGLDKLIWNATRADLIHRSHIDNFVDDLEEVLGGVVGDRPEHLAEDALAAHKGEQLQDETTRQVFTIEARLGSGASAIAYRVKDPDGKVFVLKVARAPEHDITLQHEFDALKKLRDRHIVLVHRLCSIDGHVSILMDDAGECLAARLRSDGPAQYDMLWRLGEDLLHAVDFLESEGVSHRDIKPDNMGVGEAKGTRKQTLVLFDFSLTDTAPTKLQVGTRQYLDPFLPERKIPRYDTHAERYAAALSLYEMATARLPAWGDGLTDPRYDKEAVLHLATDRFPANIREELDGFFRRALHRNPEGRFDNARDMLRAWSKIFEDAAKTATSRHGTVLDEDQITLDSPIVAIGLSPSSANVLDRLDVTTVNKLLKLRLGDLRGTKGITHQTKIEIRDAKKKWADKFPGIEEQDLPSMPVGGVTQFSTVGNGPLGEFSIDYCIEKIHEGEVDDSRAQAYKLALLGLGPVPADPSFPWPSQTAVARHYQIAGPTVNIAYGKICGRWKTKSGTIRSIRDAIFDILTFQSGVMTAVELADALLAQRGCRDQDTATRRKKSLAVLKAALDVEADFQDPRFVLYRGHHTPIIALNNELGQYADRLGDIADQLVATLPPASPAKAIERLRVIPAPGDLSLDDRRALALAAAASAQASLSPNRLELYPKGMAAIEALKLASGALAGLDAIPVREIHQRVRDRYPDAELLPDRPGLDRLVEKAELGLLWDSNLAPDPTFPDTKGAYTRRRSSNLPTASGFSLLSSSRGHAPRATRTEDQDEAEACAQRLASSRTSRGFAVLQVAIDWTILAESALRSSFPDLSVVDLEADLLAALRDSAAKMKVPWTTVVTADAAKPGTTDAQNLRRLVRDALKPMTARLRSSPSPLLLTNPGLLARYDQIGLLSDLRDAAGTTSGPPGVWVLVPTGSFGSHPTIDGVAIPIIGSHQTLVLPRAWIAQQKPQAA